VNSYLNHKNYLITIPKSCAFQANYHFIGTVKYRRSVLLGSVEVRFVEVLKEIAGQCGFVVLACRVHSGDYVYVFVSALPKIGISDVVRLLKCNSAIGCCLLSFHS
jgi:putative transposase